MRNVCFWKFYKYIFLTFDVYLMLINDVQYLIDQAIKYGGNVKDFHNIMKKIVLEAFVLN